jgi:hypothetical protein
MENIEVEILLILSAKSILVSIININGCVADSLKNKPGGCLNKCFIFNCTNRYIYLIIGIIFIQLLWVICHRT